MENRFRLDIQGLRALSVLLVFFSHAGYSLFSGGFVGVDVFFVISGYVITGLLLKEYAASEKLNLMHFYGKRVLRLLPALLLLVTASLLVSLLILTPAEQFHQYDGATASVAWLSNIYFLTYDFDYFSPAIQANMFLHTWSLGVEEQFYLIWPLILLWVLKTTKDAPKIKFVYTIGFVALLSIAFQIVVSLDSNTPAFYLMPARIWQFAIGGLVAYIHFSGMMRLKTQVSGLVYQSGTLLGLGLVVVSALAFNEHTPYPSWYAAVPSVGAALIIFFYKDQKTTVVSQVLSLKPMVWLGNLSYSFYLWHWLVLFVFEKLKLFIPGLNSLLALVLTLIAASFSYYLVEMPLRKNKALIQRPLLTLVSSMVIVIVIWFTVHQLKDYSVSKNDVVLKNLEKNRTDAPEIYRYKCDTWYHSSEVTACGFGSKESEKTVVLFGDSVVAQWFPLIELVYPASDWKIMVVSKSACPVVDVPYYYSKIKSEFKVCEIWRANTIKYIQNLKPDVVVLGSSANYPYSKADWQQGTASILDRLLPYSSEIKILASTPQLSFDVTSCLSRVYWIESRIPSDKESICHEPLKKELSWTYLKEISEKTADVKFLNFSDYICPDEICRAKVNGVITYRDDTHLTVTFVKSLFNQVKEKFKFHAGF